mgnify:FL=1
MFFEKDKSKFLVRLVDDEPDVLGALQILLESAGWKSRSYCRPSDFLRDDGVFTPGCVILDMLMPEMNGLELQLEMKERGIDLPVIFVTGHASVESAVAAFRKGAVHYLKKPVDSADLFSAIEEACSLYCAGRTSSFLSDEELIRRYFELTDRQKEVLRLVLEGLLSRDIGMRLGISHRTVLGHRATLNRVFEIRSPADLNRLAEVLARLQRERTDVLI